MNPQDLIEQSQHIGVVVQRRSPVPYGAGQSSGEKNLQNALTILCGLKKLGKDARLEHGGSLEQSGSWAHPQGKTFVVSLRGLAPWISRVYYEKDEKDLKLYFTLQQGEISQENLFFQIQKQTDLTIIVGEKEPQNNMQSQSALRQELSGKEATDALLQLLSRQTDGQTRLLGKVLAKLEHSWDHNLYGAFLEKKDFQESQTNQKALPALIANLKEHFGRQDSYLLCYESSLLSAQIQGILWSPSHELQERILSQEKGERKGNWLLFSTSLENMQRTEHPLHFLS